MGQYAHVVTTMTYTDGEHTHNTEHIKMHNTRIEQFLLMFHKEYADAESVPQNALAAFAASATIVNGLLTVVIEAADSVDGQAVTLALV